MRLASSCTTQAFTLGRGMVKDIQIIRVRGNMSKIPNLNATYDENVLIPLLDSHCPSNLCISMSSVSSPRTMAAGLGTRASVDCANGSQRQLRWCSTVLVTAKS